MDVDVALEHKVKEEAISVPPSSFISSGHLIGKKYRLEERLGEGAVGVVYRAVHVGLQKSFAIKVLKTDGSASSSLKRFRKEAVALGRLQHPNIVAVTDSGIDEAAGGVPYIVMELLEGISLSDLYDSQDPKPLAQALSLLEQIAAAVDAAHRAGVLHCDLKPANVFVCSGNPERPIVKVLDFGLAELFVGSDKLTSTETAVGEEGVPGIATTGSLLDTPLYVAPELLRRRPASRSSDIYSFGVLAYELLGGKPPFRGTFEEILAGHLGEVPPPLPLPPEIWHALREALQKNPALRPATAEQIVRRFRMAEVASQSFIEGSRSRRESRQESFDEHSKGIRALLTGFHEPLAQEYWRLRHRLPQAFYSERLRLAVQTLEWAFTYRRDLAWGLCALALLGVISLMRSCGAPTAPEATFRRKDVKNEIAEHHPQPSVPVPSRPPPPLSSTAPKSRKGSSKLDYLEEACGDLTPSTNYLCMIKWGQPRSFLRQRFVLTDNLATFSNLGSDSNRIVIDIDSRGHAYNLSFDLKMGILSIIDLNPGAWPLIKEPYPGLSCPTMMQEFRTRQLLLTDDKKVRRFVADFETGCYAVIGRIAWNDRG